MHRIEWDERDAPAAGARRELPRLAAEYFAVVRKALRSHPTPEQLHRVRLATKRLRYTLELFQRCYGPGLRERIEELRRVQQVLGELNDCAVCARFAEEAMRPSPARRKLEQFLAVRAREKRRELRQLWCATVDATGRERLWIAYLTRSARPPERRSGAGL